MSKINDLIQSLCSNGVFYKTVGEICKISRGIVMSKISIRDNAGDYPVYSSQTENNGELGKINTFMYEGEYLTWTTDGANAGSVFYRNGKFSVTNVCGLLNVVDKSINIKFLYYVLQTATKPYINKGMGNAKLMSNVMATVPVPIPPLDVQCEIVRILDNFTELTAELTAELTTRKKQYEYYRNYVLTFDNKVEWKPLWSLLFFDRRIYGIEKTKQLKILKFIHVTAKKLEELLDYGDIKLLSTGKFVGYTNISNAKNFVNNGEVIAIPAGGTANLKYWNGKFVDGGNILCSSSDTKKYSLKYIYHCLINKFNIIEQYYRGGSIKHPDMKNIIEIQIPIPPLPIQEKIVNALDNFEKICSDLQIGLPAEIEARKKQYEFYRNKLLSFDLNVTINSTIRNEREREREREI